MRTTIAIVFLVLGLSACGHDNAEPGGSVSDTRAGARAWERAIEAATGHAASDFHIDATGYPAVQLRKGATAAKVGPQVCAGIEQHNGRPPEPGHHGHVTLIASDGTKSTWDCK